LAVARPPLGPPRLRRELWRVAPVRGAHRQAARCIPGWPLRCRWDRARAGAASGSRRG